MELPPIPFELLPEIASHSWQAWRVLQQCSKRLFNALSSIDPYAAFTTLEVIDDDVDEPRLAWKDRDGIVIRVFIISNCSFFMIMYRDGRNYEYNPHLVLWKPPFHGGRFPWYIGSVHERSLIITQPGPIDVWEIYHSFIRRGAYIPNAMPANLTELEMEKYLENYRKTGNLKISRTDHIDGDDVGPVKKNIAADSPRNY
ncbi:hypothetical protein BNJ_00385 [Kaumoebavirus]|uniref:hypothetical protein n=1 Tax=Kaumoebavirus TaxID=1859492 RepID=UPI0009C36809|nr:hypothetical protein BNJ_00385 [Kaumoebavirus]ARA72204.1 hypothetical protein BNJ_00385 [Kaumoebavirus]